jgi:hypothetical protein
MKEFEQMNHTLTLENDGLKKDLERAHIESNNNLSQVYKTRQRLEEIKRMQNEEFYKVKRDEIELKKSLDDLKLKFKRSQDEVNKFKQKEDEISELREYFQEKKQKEEDEKIKIQLKHEREKKSLIGLMRLRDKGPILCLIDYLEMHEINQIAMLNKSYRNTMCNSCTFIWKSAYRNVNLVHQEKELELQRQISLKTQEIKSIIPFKDFDVLGVSDGENEFDLRKLLQMYVCDDTRVGE